MTKCPSCGFNTDPDFIKCENCNKDMPELPLKIFSVLRYSKYGTCNIYLTPDDYEGKTGKEIEKIVEEYAGMSDNWQLYEFEDQDFYEVTED
jgi:hypothetical protein